MKQGRGGHAFLKRLLVCRTLCREAAALHSPAVGLQILTVAEVSRMETASRAHLHRLQLCMHPVIVVLTGGRSSAAFED